MKLESRLVFNEKTIQAMNLTDRFTREDLQAIGNWVWEGYDRDLGTRHAWSRRTQAALDLAQQVVREKTFPWPGASNVAFPLVTIAAMQFHARAYPAIVNGAELVKYRVAGSNATAEELDRGCKVSEIMNSQLFEENESWEEQEDRLLLVTSIMGTAFKKTYRSADGRNVSDLVMPNDLVLDYYARSVEECARKTHVIPLYRNEIYEKVQTHLYRDILEEPWYHQYPAPRTSDVAIAQDKRKGTNAPLSDETTPFTMLEQHCSLDLDQDGYAEPYIVTIERDSKCVVRIVARVDRIIDVEKKLDGTIIRVNAFESFTKRGFIPSPDGGIMDIGFGALLGPINESVSTAINQLIDAGTMSTTGGGFLGRGAKIRGGSFTFAPNQWLRVDASGDDLRKSIVPKPETTPSPVLFQLLGLLIEYSNRISSATDMMVGENPGQNTPAQTSQTMVEQGMKIYSAIFKRQWRGLKAEFKKLYKLNAIYLEASRRQYFLGDPNRVVPAADPNVVSEQQRYMQAVTVKQAAMSTAGYNLVAVEKNFLRALRVEGMDILYPGPDKVPPLGNPKAAIEQAKLQIKMQELKQNQMQFILSLQDSMRLTQAKIYELQAKAMKEAAEAKGVDAGHKLAAFALALGALKDHHDNVREHIKLAMEGMDSEQYVGVSAGLPGMAGQPSNQGTLPMAPRTSQPSQIGLG